MRFLNKRASVLYCMFIALLLLALVGGASVATFADSGTNANAVVKAGHLTLHGFKAASKSIAVTSMSTTQTATYTLPLTVTDARGNGAGWNLTITSTQFTTTGLIPHTLPTNASTINASPTAVCTTSNTCTLPLNGVSYMQPLTVPSGTIAPPAVKFFSAAAGTGLGSFAVTPTISVLVPANTHTGVYKCIVSVTIVSGP